MCDGFSEAFLAAAAGASEGIGTMAGGYTAMAGAGEAVGAGAAALASNAGALATAGSALMTGVSALTQANAAKQANLYQAQVYQNNAQLAGYQRSAAIQQGDFQAQQAGLQAAQVSGQQKAALAANGLDLTSGSALDQLATSRFLAAQDINTLQSNAARAAWGYQVQGQSERINADLSRWQAGTTQPALIGGMALAGSLLTKAGAYRGSGG